MYPVIFELPSWLPGVGGMPITSFGVFMLLAFLTGGWIIRSELERMGEDPERAWDLVFMGVVGGILLMKLHIPVAERRGKRIFYQQARIHETDVKTLTDF